MHLVIRGEIPLKGTIAASGAKNSALPLLAATLLVPGISHLKRIPQLDDVDTMLQLLQAVGAKTTRNGDQVWVDATGPLNPSLPDHLVRKMRASILIMGPLAARLGRCWTVLPGGCAIGSRPVDLHIRGLALLGAHITVHHDQVFLQSGRLAGASIPLEFPSVTATENLLMAAALARGTTVIHNAAREPEVADLAMFLQKMGARISGIGTNKLVIHGTGWDLRPAQHSAIADRIEAGTFLMAAAATGGDVTVTGIDATLLAQVLAKLDEAGMEIDTGPGWIRCRAPHRPRPVSLHTAPYPGFPTDLQPPMVAMLTTAAGTSWVTETIFDNRFQYVQELRKMGADINLHGNTAVINGVLRLHGGEVRGSDLRGTAALLVAALAARGITRLHGLEHLDRGYAAIEQRLAALGASINRHRAGPQAQMSF